MLLLLPPKVLQSDRLLKCSRSPTAWNLNITDRIHIYAYTHQPCLLVRRSFTVSTCDGIYVPMNFIAASELSLNAQQTMIWAHKPTQALAHTFTLVIFSGWCTKNAIALSRRQCVRCMMVGNCGILYMCVCVHGTKIAQHSTVCVCSMVNVWFELVPAFDGVCSKRMSRSR